MSYEQTIEAGASHCVDWISGIHRLWFGGVLPHRTAHGTTAEERAVYEIGEKAGEKAPRGATLPTEAELNMTVQKYFDQQGPAEQLQNPSRAADLQAFKQAFKKGYIAGYKKTHPQQ